MHLYISHKSLELFLKILPVLFRLSITSKLPLYFAANSNRTATSRGERIGMNRDRYDYQ
jgi:hypothetical protein